MHQGPAEVAAPAGEELSRHAGRHVHGGGGGAGGTQAGEERRAESRDRVGPSATATAAATAGVHGRNPQAVPDVPEPGGSGAAPPAGLLTHGPQRLHQNVAGDQQEQLVSFLPARDTLRDGYL